MKIEDSVGDAPAATIATTVNCINGLQRENGECYKCSTDMNCLDPATK